MTDILNIILLLTVATRTVSIFCDYEHSVELKNRTHNGVKYEDGEYFVDKEAGTERGCVCMKKICINKCCPKGQGFNISATINKCVDVKETFDFPVWEGLEVKSGFNASEEYHFVINEQLSCSEEEFRLRLSFNQKNHLQTGHYKKHISISPSFTAAHYWTKDGHFSYLEDTEVLLYGPDKYCVDNIVKVNRKTKMGATICYKKKDEEKPSLVKAICMLASCFFIILTVAIYALLPELRTLHGLVMTTYLLSFFVGFLFMATMQILLVNDSINQDWCTIFSFIIYFSLLAAFFWINVMCYDLWSKFRMVIVVNGTQSRNSKRNKFLCYCAYAFGMPTALTVLLAALEFSDLPKSIVLLPHLRRYGCFLYKERKLLYLYTPIVALCIVNSILFILTAKSIAHTTAQTKLLRKKEQGRLWLYIKLFIVTGLTWIFEVLSYFWPHVPFLWDITDVYNGLIGVLIFIIFICKKKILDSIKQRYNHMINRQLSSTRTTGFSSALLKPSRGSGKSNI